MKVFRLALCATALLAGCGSSSNGGGGDDSDAPPFTNGVSTLTGRAEAGYVDGARGAAKLNNPVNVAYRDGKLYVADFDNDKIRVVDATSGDTETLIDQQNFKRPFGMVFAPDGTFYVATDNNSTGGHDGLSGTIWKINIGAKTADIVAENIGRARGMVVLTDKRIAYTDYQAHTVSVVDPASKQVSEIAGSRGQAAFADGTGSTARFNTPYGIVQRADGKLLVADQLNNRIRIVGLDGSVSTLLGGTAGFADGAAASAKVNMPQGMVMTTSGDIYLTDLGNYRVRHMTADGTMDTSVGDGTAGYVDSDDRLSAELYGIEGLSVTGDGSMLFLADGGRGEAVPYNRVRSVNMQ
ncbi:MAG TPA: SMP-30/gluconolactonase/LRE family protein [Kofleriaceae bacterium]|jgi:hypothetical protein